MYSISMTGSYKQHIDAENLGEPRSSWSTRGACSINPLPFMAERTDVEACKSVCRHCPVLNKCLAYAIANNEKDGIWGGLTPRERKALKSKLDVTNVPLEFRDHYLNVEGRVKRNTPNPTPRRNPDLDLVIDPDFLVYLGSL